MKIKLTWGTSEMSLRFPDQKSVTVEQVLLSLKSSRPDVVKFCCDRQGRLRKSLPAFVNNSHVRYLDGLQTALRDGDRLHLIPVVTGG